MNLNNNYLPYLKNKKFDPAIKFFFNRKEKLIYRDEFLIKQSKEKHILHFGFLDHPTILDKKILNNSWLHNKLLKVCKSCAGTDINHEGLNYISSKYNIKDIHIFDVTSETIPKKLLKRKFDLILLPDVIEHIENPVLFLNSLRKKFSNQVKTIIITTPNAFNLNNFFNIFKNREIINSDHRFWFTPYTLIKILNDSGFTIKSLYFSEHSKISRKKILKNLIIRFFPGFRSTIMIVADL
jgi:hypothetical protein